MLLWKRYTQYVSKSGKLSSGHRTGKGQFSFQSQRKARQRMFKLPHNFTHFTCYQAHAQNSPSQALTVCEQRASRCSSWTRKGRGTRDQIANIRWITEKAREFQKNIYFCFIDYVKNFDCMDHKKLWKILQEMEIQTTWPVSWETYMQVRKQQLELDMEQRTGFQIGKGRCWGCVLSPYLFNLHAEYIIQNARLNEA